LLRKSSSSSGEATSETPSYAVGRATIAGIYTSILLLLFGQSMPLRYPFRAPSSLSDGGNYYGELALGELALGGVVQIVIEIITDLVASCSRLAGGLSCSRCGASCPKWRSRRPS
jgi:hypothetical protein